MHKKFILLTEFAKIAHAMHRVTQKSNVQRSKIGFLLR